MPNDHHDGHEHRGICRHSLILRFRLFNDASAQFAAVCVLKAGRAAGAERSPGGSRNLTGTSSVQERRAVGASSALCPLCGLRFLSVCDCVLVLLSIWGLFLSTIKLGTFWKGDFVVLLSSADSSRSE